GDVTTLASAITIAFKTTVIGIGSGAIAYFASKLRRRWFGEYLANLDALMDAILDNIDKRDERLK
ncbi:MAG: MotA/TolQ/ExbB proton channel family protein, partial [Methanobrevibacter sp.]|nr:MotA/TolQ/ExbB proton channel family protein [Methanobrevibacter sp.]